jgi:hypothetical protein
MGSGVVPKYLFIIIIIIVIVISVIGPKSMFSKEKSAQVVNNVV